MNLLWDGVQDLGEDSSRGAPDMSVDEPPTRAPAGAACSRNKGQGRDRKQVITIINFTKISTALEKWCFLGWQTLYPEQNAYFYVSAGSWKRV